MKTWPATTALVLATIGTPALAIEPSSAASSIDVDVDVDVDVATDLAERTSAAKRLIDVMHLDQQLDAMMPQIIDLLMQSLVRGNTGKKEQVRQIISEELNTAFTARRSDMLQLHQEIYARNLTLAEMTAMTEFYETDIGQSLLSKLPQLNQEGMKGGARIGQKAAMEAMPRVIERMQAAEMDVPNET